MAGAISRRRFITKWPITFRTLAVLALTADVAAASAMAANELLLAGRGARVDATAPAVLVIDLARTAAAPSGILKLALTPERVARNEPFVVLVAADVGTGPPREIGSFSFYPPPREGETRRFLIDLSQLPKSGRAKLSVRLVAATSAPLVKTSLRVDDLRLP